jgi:hypothetical protein
MTSLFPLALAKVRRPTDDKGDGEGDAVEAVPKRLQERVSKILHRIELELDAAEAAIGNKMRVIDLDNDGLISEAELQTALGCGPEVRHVWQLCAACPCCFSELSTQPLHQQGCLQSVTTMTLCLT